MADIAPGSGEGTLDLETARGRVLAELGTVLLIGGMDTGKTTFALDLARRAAARGISVALVDADVAQSSVGPPTTVGLKMIGSADITAEDLRRADALGFVGALSPRGHLLPLVTATGAMVARAREQGAELVLVDTTGFVSGIYAQILKYHKMMAVSPRYVIAFERGGELEPLVGIAHRFTAAEVLEVPAASDLVARSAEDRAEHREKGFAGYFAAGASRWRVKPTVFMPALPPEFDLARLDGLVVGMEDGTGSCVGIGILEYDAAEEILRMVSPVTDGVRGLRLGSVRTDIHGRNKGAVSLRELFGTD